MTAAVEAGIVEPSFVTIPDRDGSLVRAVEGVAARIGRTLDPTQRFVVDVLTSSRADGRPAALEAAVICPRQNLKTWCIEAITLMRLLRPGGDRLAVWSAHELSTSQETFRTFCELAEAEDAAGRPVWPWFRSQVVRISRSTNREEIVFKDGKRLKFKARVRTGGRGLAGDLVVLDEAFALQPDHMGSLLPILSTKVRGQVIYGSSTAHDSSMILHRLMKRGRAGGHMAPAYVEWSAPGSLAEPGCGLPQCQHEVGTPGCRLDDESLWLTANPAAMHGRISLDYLRAERLALPAEEFARERLGWPEEAGADQRPIDAERWAACAAERPRSAGVPTFFIDVAPYQRSAAIGAAQLDEGVPRVEVADARPGAGWLPARVAELRERFPDAAWFHDATGGAGTVLPDLETLGVVAEPFNGSDMGRACGHLQNLVNGAGFTYQPDPVLEVAFAGAVKRNVGEGLWAWGRRRSSGEIAPLVAITGALWALKSRTVVEPFFGFGED